MSEDPAALENEGEGPPAPQPVPFRDAVGAWSRIALLSFGGPAGQIGIIHRVVVDERRWVGESRFLHALSYCMLLPGPEAQQLVTYLGWLLHGTRGALIAGTLFILPGVLAILGLSLLYVGLGHTTAVAGLFFGLKPAVLAVVLVAVFRLGRRALRGRWSVLLAGLAFLALFGFQIPFPVVIAGAAIVGLLAHEAGGAGERANELGGAGRPTRPSFARFSRTILVGVLVWLAPVALVLLIGGKHHVFATEALFFSKVAVVTFGGAYAVLAYVAQQAVEVYGWLSPTEMLDGLGLAETTPGPLIMVLQFVGFLGAFRAPGGLDPWVAGILGSLITTWTTFAPSFVFILAGAPWAEYLWSNRRLNAALAGIMAAVVGVILNLAVWFGLHTLFGSTETLRVGPLTFLWPDPATVSWGSVIIAAGALIALVRFRMPLPLVLTGAAVVGAALSL